MGYGHTSTFFTMASHHVTSFQLLKKMRYYGPQIMYNSAIPKKAWINLISKPIVTIHKVWQGFTYGVQPYHEFFHHGITSCHKLPIIEKNEVLWTSNHVQGCNSQKSMDKPHLQTYCDHSQSFAMFYFCGTAIPSHFSPCHHTMSQTANF